MSSLLNKFQDDLKQKLSQKASSNCTEEKVLLNNFKYFDLDNSGSLSIQEFKKALEKIGLLYHNTEDLKRIFDFFDSDKNG